MQKLSSKKIIKQLDLEEDIEIKDLREQLVEIIGSGLAKHLELELVMMTEDVPQLLDDKCKLNDYILTPSSILLCSAHPK